MAFLQLSRISLAFGDRDVLKNVDLRIGSGDRMALSGANGSGKSSLLRIAAGLAAPDSGERALSPELRITYLPQTGLDHAGKSLEDEAEEAYIHVHRMLHEKAEVEHKLAGVDPGTPDLHELLERQHLLEEQIEASGYYLREQRKAAVLTGLGFSATDFSRDTGEFSGGWQMRIALAKALLTTPDLLLLDEPTNYLDLEARDWLQEFLNSFAGGIVLVSHDRHFLDSCVNRVAELFLGNLRLYSGNYSAYLKQRTQELEQLKKAYLEQQEEISRLETFIDRFRYNSSKAPLVQSRIKQLEKIEPIELPESMKRVHFSFPAPPHSGRKVITIGEMTKRYAEKPVFSGLDLEVERGDKLALVGRNGAGKSTLMRIIAGADTQFEGELKLGSGVKTGYFSQDAERRFTTDRSIYQEVEANTPTELIPSLRGLLGAFLFRDDDIFKSVKVLSGGEKSRLALLELLLNPVNLLILDEPTNHLDLQTKDVLLEVLEEYTGTVIFVSHDRYFIEKLATGVFEIDNGSGRYFPGDYDYYRSVRDRYQESESLQKQTSGVSEMEPEKSDSQLHREQLKSFQTESRRLEREEAAQMEKIDRLEKEISALQQKLATPEVYSHPEEARKVQQALQQTGQRLELLHEEWESTAHRLAETEESISQILTAGRQ